MSKEGEFQKRMVAFRLKYGLDAIRLKYGLDAIIPDFIPKMLDEAREEFPIEEWKLRSKSVVSYEESVKVVEWFLKWFGEEKKWVKN
jgi:hypothetical protein